MAIATFSCPCPSCPSESVICISILVIVVVVVVSVTALATSVTKYRSSLECLSLSYSAQNQENPGYGRAIIVREPVCSLACARVDKWVRRQRVVGG